MNVWVRTVDGEQHNWDDVTVTFDTSVLQIVDDRETATFPLANVITFSTSEGTP